MKKICTTTLFILFCFGFCKAQYVTIPDTAFVSYLQLTFPSCMSGNQMDTTCSAIVNAKSVYCSNGNIADLTGIQYFKNLDTLNCSENLLTILLPLQNSLVYLNCASNQLVSLPSLPASLTYLDCGENLISSLPTLPNSLTQLTCWYNQLISLPTLNNQLTDLLCSENELTVLPTLPNSLVTLSCDNNQLTVLPSLPGTLQDLSCGYNSLTSLPSLPGLGTLTCNNNLLTALPALPSTLGGLDCYNNQLAALPALPSALDELSCYNNQITALPALPNSLLQLECHSNLLTTLPILSVQLTFLDCSNNQITALPALPNNLNSLYCSSNLLTGLPSFPNNFTTLYCELNQLTSLPSLPDVMSGLVAHDNPGLTCLPPLKKFTGDQFSFDISNTGITCLPNVIEHSGSIPAIDDVPICDIFNPNGCEVAWNIKGQLVKDGDGSCVTTNDGTPVQNISMKLYNSSNALLQQVYTNITGAFSFKTGLGTYNTVIDTTGLPFTLLCPSTDIYSSVLTSLDSLDYNANFRLYCKPNFDLGVNAITSNNSFFPNRSVGINLFAGDEAIYYGVTCNTGGLSGTVIASINGPVTITSASSGTNAVSTVSGNTITWNVTDFSQVDFNSTFSFVLHTNKSAGIGQQVCVYSTINATGLDNNPSNNTLSQCYNVLNSYDPNDKEVDPAGPVAPGYDGYLTYTIHFQNTGTAPAENIQVIDTISKNLDISTFQLVAFSNQNITQVFDGSRVVEFNFPNINLPDSSTSETASRGYVQYKIKPLSNLPAGSAINNTAYIYFDFNAPVVTNTTHSDFCNPDTSHIVGGLCKDEGSYYFNGIYETAPGTYDTTLTNVGGCDSLVILTLVLLDPAFTSLNDTVCFKNAFQFNDTLRTASGSYTAIYTAANGCDSLVQLNLVVRQPITTLLNDTLCYGYAIRFNDTLRNTTNHYTATYASTKGCDSTVTLALFVYAPIAVTQINDTLCLGSTIYFNDSLRNTSGNYTTTFSAVSGCDSVVVLHLSVADSGFVAQSADTLVVHHSTGTVKWLNCDNGTVIRGMNDSMFVASANGNYAAIISTGPCTDTSACYQVVITGIGATIDGNYTVNVYPNPTSEQLTVSREQGTVSSNQSAVSSGQSTVSSEQSAVSSQFAITELEVMDLLGRTILTQTISTPTQKITIDVSGLTAGVYFITVYTIDGNVVRKFVKQ